MVELKPPLLRGAFVQLIEDLGIIIPNIVTFQYNPSKMTRNFKPWNPFDVDPSKRGAVPAQASPFDPEETYQFTLEIDATTDIEIGNPIAMGTGIASRLAALQKLAMPTKGLIGDLVGAAKGLAGETVAPGVKKVPIALLILGTGLIMPVRLTTLSIEITEFNSWLYPLMANVQLEMRVLTPESFKCTEAVAEGFAKAAYEFTRLQEDALAILNIANSVVDSRSMLPF